MFDEKTFTLTEDHIKLMSRAYISWNDGECGAPGVDTKRPYGNSSVIMDVYETRIKCENPYTE